MSDLRERLARRVGSPMSVPPVIAELEAAPAGQHCACCSTRPVKSRGLCNACYERHRYRGTLEGGLRRSPRAPDVDGIAVERACYGDPVTLTVRERALVVARLTERGMSARHIGLMLGLAARSVQRYRAGQVKYAREVA